MINKIILSIAAILIVAGFGVGIPSMLIDEDSIVSEVSAFSVVCGGIILLIEVCVWVIRFLLSIIWG